MTHQARRLSDRGKPAGIQPTKKVVDDWENPIFDPTQGKMVAGHKVINIDGNTGRELSDRELEDLADPMAAVRRAQEKAQAQFYQDMVGEITAAKGRNEYHTQPWLKNAPKAGVKHQMLTEQKPVLSEFVKGKVDTAMVTHAPGVTQVMHVGQQGVTQADLPMFPTMTATLPANSVEAVYGSMSNAIAMNTCGASTASAAPSSTIVTDIPGVLYAQIADAEIERMKAVGQRYAFIDMDVPRGSPNTMAEFKAAMRDRGYEVNTNEIVYKSTGPAYKVLITW